MTRRWKLLAVALAVTTLVAGCAGSAQRGEILERGYPPAQAAIEAMRGKVLATPLRKLKPNDRLDVVCLGK